MDSRENTTCLTPSLTKGQDPVAAFKVTTSTQDSLGYIILAYSVKQTSLKRNSAPPPSITPTPDARVTGYFTIIPWLKLC